MASGSKIARNRELMKPEIDSGKPEAGNTTRETILSTAERLFAERGIAAVSVRSIIEEAGVNSAAVHYHFGSKDRLIAAVFNRRSSTIVAARHRLLREIPETATDQERLRALLRAFLQPALRGVGISKEVAQRYGLLSARLVTDGSLETRNLIGENFDDCHREFLREFEELCSAFTKPEIHWRMHALIGMLIYTNCGSQRIASVTDGACNPVEDDDVVEKLVEVACDLFRPGLPGRES